ncbi:MAG: 30S ribosomal protein S12 methylthiotransferase RimO [Oscillospiraceae bacterium]|nr:30S ribosomal protein S12 methylthiotransferase RimO [Oscillospiraceae bacterium]
MVSLGCSKNQTDSEIMLGILSERGNFIVSDPDEADVIIVNTCGFIEPAKQESIDTILEMAEYKKKNCRLLIAAGCLAERYNTLLAEELPEVDAVLGAGDYEKIAETIEKAFAGEKIVMYGHKDAPHNEGLSRMVINSGAACYLKIADGCDNRCTYCAIPMIRGKYRSRKIEDIAEEARGLVEAGYRELILTAQDTTRYGIDIYGEYSLDKLLVKLSEIDGLKWIRIHYFYTEAITGRLIDTMAECDKILPYIDMPIQHSEDKILRRMARKTSKSEIREKIAEIRRKMPDAVIRTTVMVGFPGETDEDFEALCDFVREIKFDRMGVFKYSREEDTPAAEFEDQVDEDVKEERFDILMKIQQEISSEINARYIGKTLEVMTEGYDEESYMYYGRSMRDSIEIDGLVYYAAHDDMNVGDFVKVKILDSDEYDLTGEAEE